MSEETSATPPDDEQMPPLEDAASPDDKHSVVEGRGADEEIRGEWQRAGEMQQESDHLREVLAEAREAVGKASDADSMASGGLGVRPEDVQDQGSGNAEESGGASERAQERAGEDEEAPPRS